MCSAAHARTSSRTDERAQRCESTTDASGSADGSEGGRDFREAAEAEDDRERRRALAEIAADRLADDLGRTDHVEEIVDDLEGDSELVAEPAHRLDRPWRRTGEVAADARSLTEERGRLAGGDLPVVVRGHERISPEPLLEHLALAEVDARLRRPADDGLVETPRHPEGPAEEEVSRHEREGEAVPCERGGAAPAGLTGVEDVVVEERRRMDQLERRSTSIVSLGSRPPAARNTRSERAGRTRFPPAPISSRRSARALPLASSRARGSFARRGRAPRRSARVAHSRCDAGVGRMSRVERHGEEAPAAGRARGAMPCAVLWLRDASCYSLGVVSQAMSDDKPSEDSSSRFSAG
jgi:hypothetical protein